MFTVRVELLSLDESRGVELEVVVDTGATFTMVSKSVAEQLGFVGRIRRRLRLGDNDLVERDIGPLLMRYEGETMVVPIAVGAEGEIPVLGATAMEILGLWVDPTGHALVRRDAFELGMSPAVASEALY